MIPAIHGRPIFQVLPFSYDVDDTETWLYNKAARWRPDRGWCTHTLGERPLDYYQQD